MSEETLGRILTVVELLATKFDALAEDVQIVKQDVEALRQESKETRQAAVDALTYLVELEEKVDVIDKDLKVVNSKVDGLIVKVDVIEHDVKAIKETTRLQQREINHLNYKTAVMRLDIDQMQDKLSAK